LINFPLISLIHEKKNRQGRMRRGTAGTNGVMMRRRMMGGRVTRIRTDRDDERITGGNA
jgi:hypothetical protein